jgi:hypothetical protein
MYLIQDRQAGNQVDVFDSLTDAETALKLYESEDRANGDFVDDFYEIVEI